MQLVISLVLYGSSCVEVLAESIDEPSAHCSLPDAQQPSQGEALLQVDFQRTAPHQQSKDKSETSPQVLKASSHGLGAGKTATKTSKNIVEEPGPGDDTDINESEKEEKSAVKKAEEGELYPESDQMGDTPNENDEDRENTEEDLTDRRDETKEDQETEDKNALLVVNAGRKGNKEATAKKQDPEDPTNSNDAPPGQEPKRGFPGDHDEKSNHGDPVQSDHDVKSNSKKDNKEAIEKKKEPEHPAKSNVEPPGQEPNGGRENSAPRFDPTDHNDEPPGQEPKRGYHGDHDPKSNHGEPVQSDQEHHDEESDKEKQVKKRVPPNLENMRHDEYKTQV